MKLGNRGIVPLALLALFAVVAVIIIVSAFLVQFATASVIFLLGLLLALVGIMGLLNLEVIYGIFTFGLELDYKQSLGLLVLGALFIFGGNYLADQIFAVTQPFAITGALEAGAIATTSQPTYAENGTTIALTTDTIIEPNGTFSGTLFSNYVSVPVQCPTGQLLIEKSGVKADITPQIPMGARNNCDNVPRTFSAPTIAFLGLAPGKYTLKLRDLGVCVNQVCSPALESAFNPNVPIWVVDARCAQTQDFAIVKDTFIGGQVFNRDSLSFPVEFFCYNSYIWKHKPSNVLEQSVLEYELLENGQSVSVPLDELWEVTYYSTRQDVGTIPVCSPDTVYDAVTDQCTVDITLVQACNGKLDLFTGTCITTGTPNCPMGQLELIKADGTGQCAYLKQETFDDSGNKFTCGVGSILNPTTFLCEIPPTIASLLCSAGEINSLGICQKNPQVDCVQPTLEWSHALKQCMALPTSQNTCLDAGFNWNSQFEFCSVQEVIVASSIEQECARLGGTMDSGVCVVQEILPGLQLNAQNMVLIIAGIAIVVSVIIILAKKLGLI